MEAISGGKDISRRRVDLIRDLCTGPGWTDDVFTARLPEILETFGGYDRDVFGDLLDAAMEAMPDNPFKAALLNAIRESDGKNLTERRTDFLEKNGSISYRTLIRHEQEGAELLVQFFDIVEGNYLRMKEEEASEDAARDADIEVLRRRVSKLEGELKEGLSGSESSVEGDIQALRSLVQEQSQLIATTMERVENLETALHYYRDYLTNILFQKLELGGWTGVTPLPVEAQTAFNNIEFSVRDRT